MSKVMVDLDSDVHLDTVINLDDGVRLVVDSSVGGVKKNIFLGPFITLCTMQSLYCTKSALRSADTVHDEPYRRTSGRTSGQHPGSRKWNLTSVRVLNSILTRRCFVFSAIYKNYMFCKSVTGNYGSWTKSVRDSTMMN